MIRSLTALALTTLTIGGCVGYTTYPAPVTGESADAAFNSPNVPPAPDVIYTALAYAVERFPVGGAYAINLPPELDEKRVEYIFNLLDDPNARRLTRETADLPVFHVSRIWIRGASAEVDIFRPVTDIPGPDGGAVTQMVTLNLKSNFTRWRVDASRSAAIGLATPPKLHFADAPKSETTSAPAQTATVEERDEPVNPY